MRENGKPTLPTAEEIENIGPHPYGGLVAEARIPVGKSGEMRNALFAHGIVLVSVQAGWGFAIMH